MSFIKSHSHSHSHSLSIFLLIAILCTPTYADLSPNINVKNNCPYTVWAAAFPDGGQRLDHGQTWTINGTRARGGQIWARTNCSFDENGLGSCETGDCGGHLHCQTHGQPPHTFVDYVLTTPTYGLDLFNISLVKGFNVPIQLIIPDPEFPSCAQGIGCIVDITGQCPSELRVSGGCNDPCTVFKTDNYCCSGSCGPTKFSRFFKQSCPDAVSYPRDDKVNTYTCQGATYYDIVFCP